MIIDAKNIFRSIGLLSAAALLYLLPMQYGSAQQFLGYARQKCDGEVTITTTEESLNVAQFEARAGRLDRPAVKWRCREEPQVEIECPDNTNEVLIDRSQGGSVFSIICLHQ